MSKRYGRSQKNKHREKIADLERAYNREISNAKHERNRYEYFMSKYKELSDHISHYCDNHSLLEPKTINLEQSVLPEYIRTAIRERLTAFPPIETAPIYRIEEQHYAVMELIEILSWIDDFKRQCHIKVRCRLGSVGYYISQEAVEAGHLNQLAIDVAKEVVELFKKNFKKG